MSLRYLFIDFDSFYASVEQQFQPALRGKPIAVVPSLGVETTCCIAASYEAKARGVKTGTGVREARYLCPGIIFVRSNNIRYIETHKKIHKVIHAIIYVDAVLSIDEMYGRLPPHWQVPAVARAKAQEIKAALKAEIGPYIGASIGLAPNRFLAKLASKLEKPDGLVTIDFADLPETLYRFELEDITGIGRRMLKRLHTARITTMEGLYYARRHQLHRIWGSIEGDRMWYALRGVDMPATAEAPCQSIGHSHVLPPRLRSEAGAHSTLHRMLQKACLRLRGMDNFTGCMDVKVQFGFELNWQAQARCFPTQDTLTLAQRLNQLWEQHPKDLPEPTKVAITLTKLVHANSHTPSLFAEDHHPRRVQLQHAMDAINKQHGTRAIYYADAMDAQRCAEAAPMRIAFSHIPDLELEGG